MLTERGVRPRNHLPVWGVYAAHFARRGDWGRAIDLLDISERSAAQMGHDVDLGHAH